VAGGDCNKMFPLIKILNHNFFTIFHNLSLFFHYLSRNNTDESPLNVHFHKKSRMKVHLSRERTRNPQDSFREIAQLDKGNNSPSTSRLIQSLDPRLAKNGKPRIQWLTSHPNIQSPLRRSPVASGDKRTKGQIARESERERESAPFCCRYRCRKNAEDHAIIKQWEQEEEEKCILVAAVQPRI